MTEQHAATPASSDTLVVTQRIAAPPEAVFPFLVEPEQMLRWMGTEARLEPTPGGEFWVNVNGSDIAVGKFTEVDPPQRVVFTWGWDGSDTIVELRHDGLTAEWATRHSEGWNHFLPLLVACHS